MPSSLTRPCNRSVYAASANSIQIKVCADSDEEEALTPPLELADARGSALTTAVSLKRTQTGILSHRRPATHNADPSSSSGLPSPNNLEQSLPQLSNRLSVMAVARKEVAKRGLYSLFFKGTTVRLDTPWKATKLKLENDTVHGKPLNSPTMPTLPAISIPPQEAAIEPPLSVAASSDVFQGILRKKTIDRASSHKDNHFQSLAETPKKRKRKRSVDGSEPQTSGPASPLSSHHPTPKSKQKLREERQLRKLERQERRARKEARRLKRKGNSTPLL